jgi:hypothetical protein
MLPPRFQDTILQDDSPSLEHFAAPLRKIPVNNFSAWVRPPRFSAFLQAFPHSTPLGTLKASVPRMQTQTLQMIDADAAPCGSNLPFKIVALYDSVISLMQARWVRCRLAAELRGEVEVESSFWYHALLSHPQLRDQAAAEASRADMIIVSVTDSLGISPPFVDWIDKSVSGKNPGSSALVLLLDHRRGLECTSALTGFLKQKALEKGLDFFARNDNKRPDLNQLVLPARKAACGGTVLPMRIAAVVAR